MHDRVLGIAVIGAGLQGYRRAEALRQSPSARLVAAASKVPAHAADLTMRYGGRAVTGWQAAVTVDEVDAVLICTPPDSHLEIGLAAIEAGKHVLCEKPMARTAQDAQRLVDVGRAAGLVVRCGFNHRFHPAVAELRRRFDTGSLGQAYFLRCAYGIAGRPGYAAEWRCDPAVVSGGHLVEQGIHAIDLAQWFLGPVTEVTAACGQQHWPIAPLEDNAMVLTRHESGATASIHASLTQWVNVFRFELGCADAVAVLDGLGGSYGEERLSVWRRADGPFSAETVSFRGQDPSWRAEFDEFLRQIAGAGAAVPAGDLAHPGVSALHVVEAAYAADRERTWRRLQPGGPSGIALADAKVAPAPSVDGGLVEPTATVDHEPPPGGQR